jgi:serine phosphatase RsbU (regulator of sigma subunit)
LQEGVVGVYHKKISDFQRSFILHVVWNCVSIEYNQLNDFFLNISKDLHTLKNNFVKFMALLMSKNNDDNMFRKETEALDRYEEVKNSNIYDFDVLMNEYNTLGSFYKKLLKQTKKLVSISDRTQKELFDTREELQEQYNYINAELNNAAEHVRSLLPSPFIDHSVSIDWIYKPSSKLGGDIFGYQFADSNHIIIYLIDVCGHGIGSALHSVSVFNTIRFQTLPKTDFADPSQVVTSLNNTFSMFDHNHLYFTMWYCILNLQTGILQYSGAGHPPMILLKKDNTIREIPSSNPPVGTAPEMIFRSNELQLDHADKIYLYTDGVYEVKDNNGKYLSINDFKRFLLNRQKRDINSLEDIISFSMEYSFDNTLEDDLTLLEINYKYTTPDPI